MTLLDDLTLERLASPHPLVDAAATTVTVAGIPIGAGAPAVLFAGPCAVESPEQIEQTAELAAAGGARLLRGGVYKPRTSPYSFQGVGQQGLLWMRRAADRHGLAMVTEAMTDRDLPAVAELADMIQVGSRSMQSYGLLKQIGQTGKPVLLKRGFAATVAEWLLAAEYLLQAGADGVVLCERGIRTFETTTRNTLDLCSVAYLLEHHGLPVIVDPSHAAGRPELVPRLSRAALATGAHGLMIELHPQPQFAKSDGAQALTPEAYLKLAKALLR